MTVPRNDDGPTLGGSALFRHLDADDDGYGDWTDDDWSTLAACCDYRDHNNATDDATCPCPDHPRSFLHPFGTRLWPTL